MMQNFFSGVTMSAIILMSPMVPKALGAEDDPVEKVRLAVAEADLVLGLIPNVTPEDPLLDKMCLRLGRFSAILRRIKGSTPTPPENTRINYVHYEHFCGWDPRETDAPVENLLPRGHSDDPAVTAATLARLATQLKTDRDNLAVWQKDNSAISCTKVVNEADQHVVTLKYFKDNLLKIQQSSRTGRFALIEHKLKPIFFVTAPIEEPIFSCEKDKTVIIVWEQWVRVNSQYFEIVTAEE